MKNLFRGIAVTVVFTILLLHSVKAQPLSALQSQVNLYCNGVCTGSASVIASGGTPPYTYTWSPSGGSGATASSLCANNYTCTIRDNVGASIVKTFTLTQPSPITSFVLPTNVICNGGNNGAVTLTASGGIGGYTYFWTPGFPSGFTNNTIINLTAGTYTCKIEDANGCQKMQSAIITQPPAITSSVITNNAACANINNGSAVISAGGGQGTFSYSWSPSGGTAASAFNLAAGSYTVTIKDIELCTKTQPVTIASITGPQTGQLAGIAGGVAASTTQPVNDASGYYTDGACNRIARLQSSGASPVAGNVETKVWVENTLPMHLSAPYVARHFEITPATNASTSTGTVTLYFLQSEFDAFNAVALMKLPTGPADASGIANLRIGKYSGTSSDNSGIPSSYSSTTTVINPDDAGIIWNATDARWEVTFDVSGFSGFVVQTSQFTLPVTWESFTAEKVNDKVLLKWKTVSETSNSHFIVEYSSDGHNFSPLNTMQATGTSSSLRSYEITVDLPKSRNNYYRIQQVGRDGHGSFSIIRMIVLNAGPGVFSIITNPVRGGKLRVQFETAGVAVIYNALGRVMTRQFVNTGLQTIDVSRLSAGVYLLKSGNETKRFTVQ